MPSHRIARDTRGVFIIAATPFTAEGAVDLESADRLVDFYLESGVDGMTILGILGEANKLTAEEARSFATRVMRRVDGRIPVVVGASGAGLDMLRDFSHFAMDEGAAGVMIAPTPGPAVEDRVRGYFHQVCEALGPDVPVCFQDFPQTTGVPVSVATILTLTRDCPQIVMLKHEDCPGLAKISAVRAGSGTAETPRLSILCGNGGLYLPQELARGADGAMTGFAYPEMLVQVVAAHHAGEADRAEDIFDAYLPILRYEQQPGYGLAVRKAVLHHRGAIANPRTRAPGPKLSATDHAELMRLIARTEARVAAL
ncbi:dihydrodipicolinate synthase family protein [Aurantimonas sp. MSK8Z-1]|uniref:dihydrodipicolinate synthase family protein n=1 Tax=Mangrovibrevibacter kandeliae TaxID=2968473 RepID=UPI0021196921|nr:dihydrodipicolinate synthase family protein [Aurantimonas sp. MSK8Z-1]MCW4115258.1 dihydrodipicolinate synthase family protein [Aurantimonas sp. MSK8Z-1]